VAIEDPALRDLAAGAALDRAAERVGMPCIVKPSRSGSALGVTEVDREADLPAAVMAALSFSGAALVEAKITGCEVACSMVGDPLDPLPLVEIAPKVGSYDYAARYTAGATDYFAPARLDGETASRATREAAAAAAALGLRGVTRIDAIVDRDGEPWILEGNVAPGMTDTSLLPMAAIAAGMSLVDVCDRILRSTGGRD
jgi:D-alanine-D-alanine ligase